MKLDLESLKTPAALIDKKILERNIAFFADELKRNNVAIRPHIKTHKSAEIAALQLKEGAIGITTATLQEAEDFYKSGYNDIFIAYPIIGQNKLSRYLHLHKNSKVSCAIDCSFHLKALSSMADKIKKPLNIRIEIDSGHNRCGLKPESEELAELANKIKQSDFLKLEGIFTHAGHAYSSKNQPELKEIGAQEANSIIKANQVLAELGFENLILSVGSTPTALISSKFPEINECRPGNYVFFDAMQIELGVCEEKDCAFSILTTVIGKYSDHIVIDAGSKALNLDKGTHGMDNLQGHGLIKGYPHLKISRLSEEHGIIEKTNTSQDFPTPGTLLEIIPNHSCSAANLFSEYNVKSHNNLITEIFHPIGKR